MVMDYLLAHGTGSAGKILSSQVLKGGSKAMAKFGETNDKIVEKSGARDIAPPEEIFFSKMNIGQSPSYADDTEPTRSYARKPSNPKDVRGILLFSPASPKFQDRGSYAVITDKSVPLATLDPQIFVFIKEDLPAVQDGQDALKKLLSDNKYFCNTATQVENALHFYPAVLPLATLADLPAFNDAMAKIISSAKAFGFCYTYDNKGRVV
jgi:hypothetical protein